MRYNLILKYPIQETLDFFNNQIEDISRENNVENIAFMIKEISSKVGQYITCQEAVEELGKLSGYIENHFSELKNKESINAAKQRVLVCLKSIKAYIYDEKVKFIDHKMDMDEDTSILVLKKILNNFYGHMKAMYYDDVHGKAKITKNQLDTIRIGNEYDVQRILFSLIKPIFPDARVEVVEDTGCSTIGYDIDIKSCNTTIEVKCSRPNMRERALNEEMGADSFHYKRKNILFFVYDKECIISSIDNYKKMYNRNFDGKAIDIIIIQPIML